MRNELLARLGLVAALAAVAVAPTSAHAQFGGLIRKAKAKVVSSEASPANSAPPRFDATTIELDADALQRVIAGLTAQQRVLAGADGADGVDAIARKRQAISAQREAIEKAHPHAQEQYDDITRKYYDCTHPMYERLQQEHVAAMQTRAMSPDAQAALVAQGQRLAAAQARGDTAAVRKIQAEIMAPALQYAHEDTIAVERACGKPPVKPAYLVQSDSLFEADARLAAQLNAVQERSQAAALQASGLTDRQFAMARERIEYYLQRAKNRHPQQGFSAKELSALDARRAELERLMS
ncbi:MAG: hypothetical protein IRY91_06990 [Gemmatimonadaceae bacterium]|nr:hypothetical protein [Gemmatimonadaceae bacterium]